MELQNRTSRVPLKRALAEAMAPCLLYSLPMQTLRALFVFSCLLQAQSQPSEAWQNGGHNVRPSNGEMVPTDAALGSIDTSRVRSLAGSATIPVGFQAHYLDVGNQGLSDFLAADAQSNVFIVSTNVSALGNNQILVTKADATGKVLTSFAFDQGCKTPGSTGVDPAGELVIAGSTCQGAGNGSVAFVLKFDPQLTKIQASAEVGGKLASNGTPNAGAGTLGFDSAGNVYLAGSTNTQDFPVTEGAFQTKLGGSISAFLLEFSPDLKTILFASYLGGSKAVCPPGPPQLCPFGPIAGTRINAITVDSTGSVIATGTTSTIDFPVTPGAYATQPPADGFVTKFAPGGGKLAWSTYVPVMQDPTHENFFYPTAIALTRTGDVVIGGATSDELPVTPGALQPTYLGYPAGFISKLDAAGQHLLFSTYFGFGGNSLGRGLLLALDSSDGIWLTGISDPSNLPQPPDTPSLGNTYIAALAPDASSVKLLLTTPEGAAGEGLVILPNGQVAVLGIWGSLLLSSATNRISVMGVANAAGFQVSGVIAPTELVSLYGYNLGPSRAMQAQVVNGAVTTSLGGYQVLFNGIPAPLLYSGPNQLNVVAPSEIRGQGTASVQIISPQSASSPMDLAVQPSQPEVFRYIDKGAYWAAALNQDQTVNSANNPAAPGTVISIWATGINSACDPDGAIMAVASPSTGLPVSVLWTPPIAGGNCSLEVLYAGWAPGAVCGVLQVNFRLADSFPPNTQGIGVQLQVGAAISHLAYIYVRR